MKKTETNLVLLNCFYCVSLIMANILAAKIVSIGFIVIPAAVVAYPFTYVITDVVGEIWGKKQSTWTVRLGLFCQIISVVFIYISIALPVAKFANNQNEYVSILGSTLRTNIASLVAYTISQKWDVFMFFLLKSKTNNKFKWLRTGVSTLTGQILDTAIFITIAFFGKVPDTFIMMLSQYGFKAIIAISTIPAFYLLTKKQLVLPEV